MVHKICVNNDESLEGQTTPDAGSGTILWLLPLVLLKEYLILSS